MAFSAYPNTSKRRWPMELGGFLADDHETIYNYGLDGQLYQRKFGKSTIWEPAPDFDLDAALTKAVDDLLANTLSITIEQLVEMELHYGMPSR